MKRTQTAAVLGFLYSSVGGFNVTLQDMREALANHPSADVAIFWWCFMWQSGKGSDLYRIMSEVLYTPTPNVDATRDPEVADMICKLDARFGDIVGRNADGSLVEPPLRPVLLRDVQEDEYLIAGSKFLCLHKRWPCRVYRHHGGLGVACGGGVNHVGKVGEHFWHPFQEDDKGFIIGFRR